MYVHIIRALREGWWEMDRVTRDPWTLCSFMVLGAAACFLVFVFAYDQKKKKCHHQSTTIVRSINQINQSRKKNNDRSVERGRKRERSAIVRVYRMISRIDSRAIEIRERRLLHHKRSISTIDRTCNTYVDVTYRVFLTKQKNTAFIAFSGRLIIHARTGMISYVRK